MEIKELVQYLKEEIEPLDVLKRIQSCIKDKSSTAGSTSKEEIFTREFLCPKLADFFYTKKRSQLNLSDSEIQIGLGTEGFKNVERYGFTPARANKHFLTKGQIIANEPPEEWFKESSKKLTSFMACPDFAIRNPLPFNIVGEVKYFSKGSEKAAIKELYNDIRQAMFYLGAFNEYKDCLLVIADASPENTFTKALNLLEDDLLLRFGIETNIHLCIINLKS